MTLAALADFVEVGEPGPRPPPTPIDLNSASVTRLDYLPGIGPITADRIVAARNERLFASVDDLQRVHGIGPKTLEKIRDRVCVLPRPRDDHGG